MEYFRLKLKAKFIFNFFTTGPVYYGFGFPLGEYSIDQDYLQKSLKQFQAFIENILKFYKTTDLLKMNGSKNLEYPLIEVELNDNSDIIAIGNIENDLFLEEIENGYTMSKNIKRKILNLAK